MTLSIPKAAVMGVGGKASITQYFTAFPDGSFLLSDNAGSSFRTYPIGPVNSGIAITTLVANDTVAKQTTLVTTGHSVIENLTTIFSVFRQYCQVAGVRLVFSGFVNWGPSGSGVVTMPFRSRPLSVIGDRAWFGNQSGQALGFDWSDSAAQNPSFSSQTNTLSWTVGSQFTIDPVTVGSSTGSPLSWQFEGHVCYGGGLNWVFFWDGSHEGYVTSPDAITWSSETTMTITDAGPGQVSFYCAGNTVFYASSSSATNQIGGGWFFEGFGTLQSSGTIAWAVSNYGVPTTYQVNGGNPTITRDTKGNLWVADNTAVSGTNHIEIWNGGVCSGCQGGYYWTKSTDLSGGQYAVVVPLTHGKIGVVYSADGGSSSFKVEFFSGTTWGSYAVTAQTDLAMKNSGFTAMGDTIKASFFKNGLSIKQEQYASVPYSTTPTWSAPTLLESDSNAWTSITTDGASTLMLYTTHGSTVQYFTSNDNGSTWSSPTVLSTSETPIGAISTIPVFSGVAAAVWVKGNSNPFTVRFASFPSPVPTAAVSPSSWSKPGLSPYESYLVSINAYVSPGNGLLGVEQTDLSLPGRGLDLAITRVYSTPYAFRGAGSSVYQFDNFTLANLGLGWSLNFPWLGTYYLHLTDGQAYPYRWVGSQFVYHHATDFNLTKNGDGSYTLALKDGRQYQFNSAKQLMSITDRTGSNAISFAYGANGISQITDTVGRTVTFAYTGGLLSSITSGGRTWNYAYTSGRLTSVTDPMTRMTQFAYVSTNGWLVSSIIYPTTGKLTFAYGNTTVGSEVRTYYVSLQNFYSSATTLTRSERTSYNIQNGQVVWANTTLSDGLTTQGFVNNNYQPQNNLSRIYYEDNGGTPIKVKEMDSDSRGRTIETKTLNPHTGAILAYSTSTYDSWGNAKYTQDEVGQQTWFSYANTDSQNSFGTSGCTASFYSQTISNKIHDLPVGQCDFQNAGSTPLVQQETYYQYDAKGNLLEKEVSHNSGFLKTDHTYDNYGNVLSTTDANGHTTYFRFSSAYGSAYLTKQSILVGTQNVTTTYTWDFAKGVKLSQTDPNGQTTSFSYDVLGRLTLTTYPAVGGFSGTKQVAYDDVNNIMTTTDQDGHLTKQYFDGLGRQTKVERWNGSSVYSSETYTYNWLNLVATKTTAAGSTYTYAYDSLGRQTQLTNPDSTSKATSYGVVTNSKVVVDENQHQVWYIYDWDGRLIQVNQFYSATSSYNTVYYYDSAGNLYATFDANSQEIQYSHDDLNRLALTTFPDSTESRTYDNVGNLLTKTDQLGNAISYAYDALNRLTTTTYPGSGGTVTTTYDAASNVLSVTSPSASVYHTYDALRRSTNDTIVVGGAKYSTVYSYDQLGNILSTIYPDSYALTLTYDAVNRVKTMGSFATISYTPDDKVSKIIYGDTEVQTYTYDNRDRVTRILDTAGSPGTKRLDLNYTYDAVGNVMSINTEGYAYDWLNRLTSSSGPWGTTTYTYDGVGNLLQTVAGTNTTNFTYVLYNKMSAWGGVSYAYDGDGNLVTKSYGTTSFAYSYDYENRLTQVSKGSTVVAQNSYDGLGRLVKNVETDTKVFTYQGLHTIYEKDTAAGVTTTTKHFYADGMQLAKTVRATTYYLHGDNLGSTRLVMSSSLVTMFSTKYKPYGPTYGATGSETFKFTDKPYDPTTGLYYYGARFYDPSVGRFITRDSYNGTVRDPLSQNRYIYAEDNPLRYVDPSGHDACHTSPDACLGQQGAYQYGAAIEITTTQFTFNWKVILDVVNVAADLIGLFLGPLATALKGYLSKAALSVLVGSAGLTLVGQKIEEDFLGHNLAAAISDGMGILGSVVSIAFSKLDFIAKSEVAVLIAGWAGGNALTAGGLEDASLIAGSVSLGLDVDTLIYDVNHP